MGEEFKDLPAWAQALVSAAIFLVSGIAAILGYTKKFASKVEDQKNQDAVVISAAFADSKVIAQLAVVIEKLHVAVVQHTEKQDRANELKERQIRALDYATEEIRRVTLELVRRDR